MEIISIGFLIVAVIGMIFFMAGVLYAEDHFDKLHGCDSDMRIYVPSRDRDRGRRDRCPEQVDAEEVVNGLQALRMALSPAEKEYLDYACECVLIVERINDANVGDD